jgi:hypothetical protein
MFFNRISAHPEAFQANKHPSRRTKAIRVLGLTESRRPVFSINQIGNCASWEICGAKLFTQAQLDYLTWSFNY